MNAAAASAQSSRLTTGYLICLVGTVLWSSTAVFIGYLTRTYQLPSLVLAFWRDVFVSLGLAGYFLLAWRERLRVPGKHLRFLAAYGFLLSIFNALWTVSVTLNGAAVATVLAYSSPAYTALLSWRLFGERLDRIKVLAVVLCIGGCALISGAYNPGAWRLNLLGIVTGLLSGVAFAGYSLMGKAASNRALNPWTTLLYTFGFASCFLLAYNLAPALIPGGDSPPGLFWLGTAVAGWLVLILLALLPSIGGYGLYTVSLTYLPATIANLIATLEPSLTAMQSYLLLGERFTPPQIAGSLLIIGSVVMLRLTEGRFSKA